MPATLSRRALVAGLPLALGAGNAAAVNADLPAGWSAGRTRPLCPWPQVAAYRGSGSVEDAAGFACR